MRILEGFFREGPPEARELFLSAVQTVEMAISSYCNRRCAFCPNAVIDRHSARHQMDDALYSSVLGQLAAMGWAGDLRFHRYNEPLADRPYVLRRLDEARRTLPSARLTLFTNGDYLTADTLAALYDAGLRAATVTVYLPDQAEYTDAALRQRLLERLRALGLPWTMTRETRGHHQARLSYRDMELVMRACDYTAGVNGAGEAMTFDRGGVVGAAPTYRRVSPCLAPFTQLQIEWDGTMLPCCNLLAEVPEHASAILGRLQPGDNLLAAWTNPAFVAWRKSLFSWDEKAMPCTGCSMDALPDTPQMQADVAAIRERYGLGGA